MKTYSEQKSFAQKMNLMDDILFNKVMEDKEACEEMLRVILEDPNLMVIDVQTQRFLRNIGTHSVILDVLCQDCNGNFINVEMQKSNADDYQRRVRFNHANIDTSFVEQGIDYKNLPDVRIIFLSKFDVFGEHCVIYHVNRVIEETGTIVDNGVQEIYVNAAVKDRSDISELMQYFKNTKSEHPKFKKIAARVSYFKEQQEGVDKMCDLVEEYANQKVREEAKITARETVKKLLALGISKENILDICPLISEEEYEQLRAEFETA